jgi:ParB-like chromosome segregation protein Spo0J
MKLNIKDIKLNDHNPRDITPEMFEKLKKSIQEFPQMLETRPLVIDENNVVLGGNMRLRALADLGYKEIPVQKVEGWSEEQKKEFIVKDNVSYGVWDWELLANSWDAEQLGDWGLEVPGFDLDSDNLGTEFSLPDGDKAPFQQMTFTLADQQAEAIKDAIADIKKTDEYKYAETMGNENSNGNALYLIIMQWAEQRK